MQTTNSYIAKWIVIVVLIIVGIHAQANVSDYYVFCFDLRGDDQHAAIINYEYTLDSQVLVKGSPSDFANFHGILLQSRTVTAKGSLLHVKWKDTLTDLEYEESVHTLQYLPDKMAGKALSMMIKNNHLMLYITDMKKYIGPQDVSGGPSFMGQHPSVQIFPRSNQYPR